MQARRCTEYIFYRSLGRVRKRWRDATRLLSPVVPIRSVIERLDDFDENRRQLTSKARWIGGDVHSRRLLAAALVMLGWAALAQGKDLALISNKSNEVVTITLPELVKVC